MDKEHFSPHKVLQSAKREQVSLKHCYTVQVCRVPSLDTLAKHRVPEEEEPAVFFTGPGSFLCKYFRA